MPFLCLPRPDPAAATSPTQPSQEDLAGNTPPALRLTPLRGTHICPTGSRLPKARRRKGGGLRQRLRGRRRLGRGACAAARRCTCSRRRTRNRLRIARQPCRPDGRWRHRRGRRWGRSGPKGRSGWCSRWAKRRSWYPAPSCRCSRRTGRSPSNRGSGSNRRGWRWGRRWSPPPPPLWPPPSSSPPPPSSWSPWGSGRTRGRGNSTSRRPPPPPGRSSPLHCGCSRAVWWWWC